MRNETRMYDKVHGCFGTVIAAWSDRTNIWLDNGEGGMTPNDQLLPVEVVVFDGKLRRNVDGRAFVMTNEGRELCPFAHISGDDEVRLTIERVKKEG